jgi:hypothetical protein
MQILDQRLTTYSSTASSYTTDVPFPQLDSSPHTLFSPSSSDLGIRAALTTSSETRTRLTDMGLLISRALAVDAREALLNDLAELGEAYTEGYQSSLESGEDE